VGSEVAEVTLRQDFLQVIWFLPVNIITPCVSIPMYRLGDELQARWWPQFRDIASSHRHEHDHAHSSHFCNQYRGAQAQWTWYKTGDPWGQSP
jgi:hypothetical protein